MSNQLLKRLSRFFSYERLPFILVYILCTFLLGVLSKCSGVVQILDWAIINPAHDPCNRPIITHPLLFYCISEKIERTPNLRRKFRFLVKWQLILELWRWSSNFPIRVLQSLIGNPSQKVRVFGV